MEILEELHRLSREAETQAAALRETISRIRNLPIRNTGRCTYKELIASGYTPGGNGDYGHGTARSATTRIIEQREAAQRLIVDLQGEVEILIDIADDLIGDTGRLF